MKRYKRPFSLRVADSVSAAQNSLCVYWHGKNLRGIHESWLGSHASMISSIDLHQNKLTELPSCFFELLPNLEDVDLSLNLLTTLPERGLNRTRLFWNLKLLNFCDKIIPSLNVYQSATTI